MMVSAALALIPGGPEDDDPPWVFGLVIFVVLLMGLVATRCAH